MKEVEVKNDLHVEVLISKDKPVILFDDETLKKEVQKQLEKYEKLVITEDNKQELKGAITLLNNTSALLNRRRIDIGKELLKLYKVGEVQAKIIEIDNLIEDVKAKLKAQVDKDEDYDKALKENMARDYFNELIKEHELGFLEFKDVKLGITLTISNKKVRDTIKEFIDNIVAELKAVEHHPHKIRILAKYYKTLNMNKAQQEVGEEIQAENKLKEELVIPEPKKEVPVKKVIEEEKEYKMKLWATISQVRSLQEFLKKEGIKYE